MSFFRNICRCIVLVFIFFDQASGSGSGSGNKTCNILLNNYLIFDIFETHPDVLENINTSPSIDLAYTGRYAGPTDKSFNLFEASYLNFGPEFKTKRFEVSYYKQKEITRKTENELLYELSKPENIEFYGKDFVNARGYYEPSLTLIELKFGTTIATSLVRNTLLIRDKKTLEILGVLSWSFETHKKFYFVGYLVFKKYRRRGVAKEVLLGTVDIIRSINPSSHIALYILENNIASQKLAEDTGFKRDIFKSISLRDGYKYYLP